MTTLPAWDPATVREDAVVLVVGGSAEDRAALAADLLWHKRDRLAFVADFSNTETSNTLTGAALPVYHCDDARDTPGSAKRMLEWLRRGTAPPVGVVLSDATGPAASEFVKVGRHFRALSVFLAPTMTATVATRPEFSCNVDYVVMLELAMCSDVERLHAEYAKHFPEHTLASLVAAGTSRDGESIVLNTRQIFEKRALFTGVFCHNTTPRGVRFGLDKAITPEPWAAAAVATAGGGAAREEANAGAGPGKAERACACAGGGAAGGTSGR